MDFGAFCELEPGLTTLLHSSELAGQKNVSAKKMFKVGDVVDCIITEIDKDKEELPYLIDLRKIILTKLLKRSFCWANC